MWKRYKEMERYPVLLNLKELILLKCPCYLKQATVLIQLLLKYPWHVSQQGVLSMIFWYDTKVQATKAKRVRQHQTKHFLDRKRNNQQNETATYWMRVNF